MNNAVKTNVNPLNKQNSLSISIFVLLLFFLLTGNGNNASAFQSPARAFDPLVAYNASIYDSAVYKSSNVRKLFPLKFDPVTKTAKVVTLTSYDYTQGGKYKPPFQTDTGTHYSWVTAAPEVQNICKGFPQNELPQRLTQLLGLKPNSNFTHFVTLEVTSGQVFRPATNPDPTSDYPCSISNFVDGDTKPSIPANCGEVFEKDSCDVNYQMWFLDKTLSTYAISDDPKTEGYPWTRLGYTYNWNPGSDKYGASEYVINLNSVVTVKEIMTYQDYCNPKLKTAEK